MPETDEEISGRRQNLVRAARVHPNPKFVPLLEKSNADDLEWLLGRLNTQIAETPQWVDDPVSLRAILARLRAKRTAVADALGNRRPAEKLTYLHKMRRSTYAGKAISIIGVLIAFFALLVAYFK